MAPNLCLNEIMLIIILLLLVSLVILTFGANYLVKGSSNLALRCGLTPLAVGLTVVAFGTSSPELIVSLKAALAKQGDIAVGNVVGSNIFNIAFILGLTALICPMKVENQIIKVDLPIMIGVGLFGAYFLMDGQLTRLEGIIFFLSIIGYTIFTYFLARKTHNAALDKDYAGSMPKDLGKLWSNVLMIIGGLALLVLGGKILVENAVALARILGMSEALIGLTIVAAGTSMPELATSIVAAFKKEPEIAIGNIVGSNIFNILLILGLSATVQPMSFPGIQTSDLVVMLIFSLVLLPLMATNFQLKRWEGAALFLGYGIYLYSVWPQAK